MNASFTCSARSAHRLSEDETSFRRGNSCCSMPAIQPQTPPPESPVPCSGCAAGPPWGSVAAGCTSRTEATPPISSASAARRLRAARCVTATAQIVDRRTGYAGCQALPVQTTFGSETEWSGPPRARGEIVRRRSLVGGRSTGRRRGGADETLPDARAACSRRVGPAASRVAIARPAGYGCSSSVDDDDDELPPAAGRPGHGPDARVRGRKNPLTREEGPHCQGARTLTLACDPPGGGSASGYGLDGVWLVLPPYSAGAHSRLAPDRAAGRVGCASAPGRAGPGAFLRRRRRLRPLELEGDAGPARRPGRARRAAAAGRGRCCCGLLRAPPRRSFGCRGCQRPPPLGRRPRLTLRLAGTLGALLLCRDPLRVTGWVLAPQAALRADVPDLLAHAEPAQEPTRPRVLKDAPKAAVRRIGLERPMGYL
eukprot:scaffold140_cov565-Prasinococcus_capsulatus_cf.AAC.31